MSTRLPLRHLSFHIVSAPLAIYAGYLVMTAFVIQLLSACCFSVLLLLFLEELCRCCALFRLALNHEIHVTW